MIARIMWMCVGGITIALIGWLGVSVAQLVWHRAGHTSVMPIEVPDQSARPTQQAPQDLSAITALAPFGQSPDIAGADDGMPPATSLNIALRGVLKDADTSQSRAFLRAEGRVDVYRIGDAVLSAKLTEIGTDTVTLRLGDETLVVGFDGMVGVDAQPQPTVTASEPDGGDPFARLAAAIVPGQGSIDLRDAPPPETTEDYINLWRDRITRNPQDAMDRVGVELVENGYRVKPDPNIGVTLAGLRPGDVITGLNGQSVGELEQDRVLYDEVAASGIARVEVVRDGQSLLLTFPLR